MRRLGVVLALAATALIIGGGLAVAAFTTHQSTPQSFTAADSFRPQDRLEALSKTNDGGAAGNQIQFGLRLRNTGETRIDLNSVTVRYWFTGEGSTSEPLPFCYYATFGCHKLKLGMERLSPARTKADHYLKVTFQVGSGRLDPGRTADLDQLAIGHAAGGTFTQPNDHSFLNADSFTSNSRVTVYVGGTLVWGVEPGALPQTEKVEVRYANRDTNPGDTAILFRLDVHSTGTLDIDLDELTLRYWFTRDGAGMDALLAFCDYAEIGCGKVLKSFTNVSQRPGADTYLQIGFDRGVLHAGGSTGSIEMRLHRYNYAPWDETNDFSRGTNTSLQAWPKVTAYLRGTLVWGTEP